MDRRLATSAATLLLVLFVVQVVALVGGAGRAPHVDEVEYLHAAWLMEQGERLYVSFFEHHPPFLFAALRTVATDDVPAFLFRARVLSGAFGLVALAAFAAIVWRVRPEAAPIAVALLFASSSIWNDGLVAARAEPFSFAFFWVGAALVLLAGGDGIRAAFATGAGAGFVAIAALWNPKWPFCSVVVVGFWFVVARRRLLSGAVALAITAAATLVMHRIAPLDQVWFFSVEFTRALWPFLSRSQALLRELRGGEQFLFAPALLGPVVLGAVFLIVSVAAALTRFAQRRLLLFFLLLAGASALELRLTFPWPVIWSYYYLMWGCAAAALAGFVPAALDALLARARVPRARSAAIAVAVVILAVAAAHIIAAAPFGLKAVGQPSVAARYLQSRLQPADTVLIDLTRHPVAARDGGYYWFLFGHILPVAEDLRSTARGARYLPPVTYPYCAVAAGRETRLRFVAPPRVLHAPASEQQCFDRLLAAGRLRNTPFAGVFEVAR